MREREEKKQIFRTLGPDCGLNENSRLANNAIDRWQRNSSKNPIRKEDQFDVRQTGENFRSDAPPDCRIADCSWLKIIYCSYEIDGCDMS